MKNHNIDFYGNRKKYFGVSLVVIAIGILFNIIVGTQLDMQFTGGAIIKYSYSGEIDSGIVEGIVESATGKNVSIRLNKSIDTDGHNSVSLSFAGTESLPLDHQRKITESLGEKYPEGNFSIIESSSINPNMGRDFFLKCMACIAIAVLILVIYIALRFRKIGGMSAGVMAIIALIHDIVIVYLTFVVFRVPLNDSFIAVVLTILGYSLNDTIVIYDRIRENSRLMGPKVELSTLVNKSINQTLGRSIFTSVTTFLSIATVFVAGAIYKLPTITTFAFPMMVGVVVGCYSSVCIAGPLYVMWKHHKDKVETEVKA